MSLATAAASLLGTRLAYPEGGVLSAPRGSGGDPGENRGTGPATQREAASGIPQRRLYVQAPDRPLRARLIDQCGLKGVCVGGAQVSEKHAGFVVNRGGATCADVLELVERVKARVLAETGVALEMEVKVLR